MAGTGECMDTPRAYQLELFEESMQRNLIIAVCPLARLPDYSTDYTLDGNRERQDLGVSNEFDKNNESLKSLNRSDPD